MSEKVLCKNCGHKIIKKGDFYVHGFEVLDEGIGKGICNNAKQYFRNDTNEVTVEICGCFNPKPVIQGGEKQK